ncbi:protein MICRORCHIDIA 7-like isoform X2 [Humulus lupulus]|uniref:protein MICRORCHIDIA 7-like isoform X2 n=1 Tax=Humulus lupulus TaxID=3486 RepID=UPI002B4090BA|nr:protein MICRORCHIDIA 7-like isoform X2 [Humulus lupulus]
MNGRGQRGLMNQRWWRTDGGESNSWGGMDHIRVHPKFLHSNATCHKWALGAFAELIMHWMRSAVVSHMQISICLLIRKMGVECW